jgi:predicted regulator of Ras-like GTPase activity (Roadblock/LC7/MglB family)
MIIIEDIFLFIYFYDSIILMQHVESLENALRKIESIMRKRSINELTFKREYLPEIFTGDLVKISKNDDLPTLKSFLVQYFNLRGFLIRYYGNMVKFIKLSLETSIQNSFGNNPDIQGAAIFNLQGFSIRSILPRDVDEAIVSAMSAAILSVSERAVEELERGKLKRILIEGIEGTIILSKIEEKAILCTLTKSNASLGMVFLGIQGISREISRYLAETEENREDQYYCTHCGAELPEGQIICHVCGNTVE